MKTLVISLIAVFLTASLFSCAGKREANRETGDLPQVKILATVNGVPITEDDVNQSVKRVVHGEKVNPGTPQNLLEALVRNELIYQQSIELGLDRNPQFRKKIREVEAQLRAFQWQEISALFREHVRSKAEVTDAEAREFFERNAKRIRTRYHLWQIFFRGGRAGIADADKELKNGVPFEKVASRRFPNLPRGMKAPWDLGYLYWSQIPAPWQATIDRLEPGRTSDIIEGPNERFWIIRLVDKSSDPNITFDTEKGNILEALRKKKADELYDAMLGRMREKSKIIFPKPAEGGG